MTALDQAFIKAFGQQGRFSTTTSPRKVVPLSEHLAAAETEKSAPAFAAVRSVPVSEPTESVRSSGGLPNEATLRSRRPIASITPVPSDEELPSALSHRNQEVRSTMEARPAAVATISPLPVRAKPTTSGVATPTAAPLHNTSATTAALSSFAPWNASVIAGDHEPTVAMPQWSTANDSWPEDLATTATHDTPEAMVEREPAATIAMPEKVAPLSQFSPLESRLAASRKIPQPVEAEDTTSHPAVLSMSDAVAAQPKAAAASHFQPAWQVDRFTWPKVCRRLITKANDELDRLADAITAVHDNGQKVLGMAACRRGEGATTMLLCAARRLGERGIRVAIVDADLNRPRLAKRLGVQPQFGWNEATESQAWSLDQAVVEATGNNVALLPIRDTSLDRHRIEGDDSNLTEYIHTLRDHYDLVLVDLGPLENLAWHGNAPAWTRGGTVDSILLVHNEQVTSEDDLAEVEHHLSEAGISVTGLIENFVAV